VVDSYCDPKEECIHNESDEMLALAISDSDALYWETDMTKLATPKCKKVKVDEESVTDSLSTVKTAISLIKTCYTRPMTAHPLQMRPWEPPRLPRSPLILKW